MAKKKEIEKDVKNIEVEAVQEVPKKTIPTKEYTIKNRVHVRGKWLERGEKISLTKEGWKFFLSKKYI